MKQKLKILFAQFRGVSQSLGTTILLDRYKIEDWNKSFVTNTGNYFSMTTSIENILEELIELYYPIIVEYLDFDIDEYWYLEINIFPEKKTLIFTASCKEEVYIPFSKDYEYIQLDDERKILVDTLYSEFSDNTKIEFQGYGRYGDGETFNIEVNNRPISKTYELDDALWSLVNYFMTKINGNWWNDGPGANYNITIWGDDIFVKGHEITEEFNDTGMVIRVTPDNLLDNVED